MALELVHTSAPAGLRPGTSGFCTVAMTTGMPSPMEERLLALGGYRPDGAPGSSPPSFSHLRLEIGGRTWSVLGAVREAAPDHSGRRNKLAHHIVLAEEERAPAGPAWLLRRSGVMLDRFDGPPRWIPAPREIPASGSAPPRRCDAWQRACGDAGWAGELVNQWHLDPSRTSCIVHPREADPLELIDEALSLLPPPDRWRVTFATNFQQPVAGAHAAWRFCREGTMAASEAPSRATGLYLDLAAAHRERSRAGHGRYAELARGGRDSWWHHAATESSAGSDSERRAASRSATNDDRPLPWSGIDRFGAAPPGTAAQGETTPSASSDAGAFEASLGARTRRRSSSGPALAGIALLALVLGGAGGVLIERLLLGGRARDERRNGVSSAGAEIDRLDALRLELESQLKQSEASLAKLRDDHRRVDADLDLARRERDSALAQLRSMEALRNPSAPAAEPPRDAPPQSVSPPSAPATAPQSAPVDAAPAPPDAPVVGPQGVIELPASAWAREASSLGVLSSDRRRLVLLPRAVRSLRIDLSESMPSISHSAGRDGRRITIAASPPGAPRRDVLVIDAEGGEVFSQWVLAGPISRSSAHLDAVDSLLALADLEATLDDGSTRRLVSAPRGISVKVPRRESAEVSLPLRSPSMRLAAAASPEWTLADGSTETSLRMNHASGALRAELDRASGTLRIRFGSPLADAVDAAEKEQRELVADRPNVPPDERQFHEAREREVRERLARLKTQLALDSPRIPADLPLLRVMAGRGERVFAVITLKPPDAAGGAE
ncbi:MAG: hypothetical protein FJ253_00475 [Phycisphaerae bacterium]|nr:hypothetical protein [Phycisphaerae bacterium]